MRTGKQMIFQRGHSGFVSLSLVLTMAVAQAQTASVALKVEAINASLQSPWGLAFLPDGRMLVTEKGGTLKLLTASGQTQGALGGVPVVNSAGQGGLLDVAIDPAFASNQRIYLSYSENDLVNPSLSGTAVARARLDLADKQLRDVNVIYRQLPKVNSSGHFGSRLVFDRSGYLFVTLGDRQSRAQRGYAQDVTHGNGKVVRITTDGKPVPDNPRFSSVGALPGLWSYGHRNSQGAALQPASGELWISEHGPQGGDEINRVLPGRNYGWPVISYGQEYGTPIAVGEGTTKEGMEQPISVWVSRDGSLSPGLLKSSIAPSGLVFYTSDKFPEFQGNLFSGALAGTALWRVVLGGPQGNTEVSRERLLASLGERIRDVRQGQDGWIYLLTDSGKLLRLTR
ncbi:MAG: PQQ-dependent sugar dehydrogenase [Comamonadaceae bacterium]|nr:PQQ-dependent sugar dehydrogenase [Comamonadaceae bacterium]